MSGNLDVEAFVMYIYDGINNRLAGVLQYIAVDYFHQPSPSVLYVYEYGTEDPSASPYPLFPDDATALAYYTSDAEANLISQVNDIIGTAYYTTATTTAVSPPTAAALNMYALISSVPTLLSQLTNDAGFITSAPVSSVNGKTGTVVLETTDLSDFSSASNALITTQINALVNGAPGALDTLKELADAIGDNASYAASIVTALAGKQAAFTGSTYQYVRGDGTLATFPTITTYTDSQAEAAALIAPLTGLSAGSNAAIASSDTILAALAKLQAQITANFTRTTSNITPSLVGTGATGTQVSATKNSTVRIWLSESVTSNIGGAATAVVNVKICPTNNATEASWTTLGTFEEDQTVTLAIALQSVQIMKGIMEFDLPAGYYWKAESSGSGTNSESIISGQQTIYG